jgi:uncharacterized protein (TIGR02588 family)
MRKASSKSPTAASSGKLTRTRQQVTSRWEWVAAGVAGVGALLIASVMGYMIWYGSHYPQGIPPELTVRPLGMQAVASGYLVTFRADNEGSSTAAQVLISGVLKDADGLTLEESEATVDYVPQHSHREGGLLFSRDPSAHKLELRVEGYADP